ncbi:hypothetical protein HUJ05_008249 [Dendroctonus ponderosae]|nr:hypothetical protein HUJ05_008249 [Dendroctonus ponderosae]
MEEPGRLNKEPETIPVALYLEPGILARWSCEGVFLNHEPFPTYSLEDMPETQFSCREKILGGYYADPDAQCQMFHVCVKVAGIGVQDFRFLCPNGTAFDQDHQICADWEDVDCDATTLYYSSDNFDLYRVGSGFESKAHKYGEDEETFALQRAETGDARINREPQSQVVNQQKDYQRPQARRPLNNNNNNNAEKDIFRTSSSSNFFNNRNNGKETDEDYDDNVNVNQDRDFEQKRKIVRKQQRRPVQQQTTKQPEQEQQQLQTRRPQRPTGFANNFAGSSYNPTTQRATSTPNNEQSSATFRSRQRQRVSNQTPSYTVSTPAPFRSSANHQFSTSSTENYPQPRATNAPVSFNTNYDVPRVPKQQTQNYPSSSATFDANYDVPKVAKQENYASRSTSAPVSFNSPKATKQQTENYPSNNPQYSRTTTPLANSQYSTAFDKKSTSPKKAETYKPTTFSPKAKPFSVPATNTGFPTTFAPRTQQAYTQIAQQTQKASSNFAQQQFSNPSTTQRSTTFTPYTPTVPKISSTTAVPRSNRYDETQYDDGSYDAKYDNSGANEEEFLKTAHSQNIASSRNELARAQKQQPTTTTQKPYEPSRTYSTQRETQNYPKSTQPASTRSTQVTQRPVQQAKPQPSPKKVKDVSYDYAYYDSLGPEPDYQIDTEIKKSSKN